MEFSLDLWLEYILRFSHLVAGISWIGSSFYFIWLDSSFEAPEVPRRHVEGELFMVHGGFYYQVEKRKIYPNELPKVLHWFKWEATLTVLTGFLLFIVLYYFKGASLMIDSQIRALSPAEAISWSLGLIAGSWFVYDLIIWNANLIKSKAVSIFLSILFFTGLIYLNSQLFSGRGAFIQTGAMFGTMMLANVWVRILPGQRKMIADAQAGKIPDYSLSLKSKTRSVHNTYFTFPVLFIMISNHYAAIYNHPQNWMLLILLSVSGALVRHAMVTKRSVERWTLFPAAIGLAALVFMTRAESLNTSSSGEFIEFSKVREVFQNRCLSCHGASPTDDIFKVPPKGVVLESEQQILQMKDKIIQQVVIGKTMPLANKTGMTEDERQLIYNWLNQHK